MTAPALRAVSAVLVLSCALQATGCAVHVPRVHAKQSHSGPVPRPDRDVGEDLPLVTSERGREAGSRRFELGPGPVAAILVTGLIVAALIAGEWLVKRMVVRTSPPKPPVLHVDPPFLNFGLAKAGETAAREVIITNRSGRPLHAAGLAVSGRGFSLEGVPALPAVLADGERISLRVRFAPFRTGSFSGSIEIVTDYPTKLWRISVVGRGM